MSERPHSANQDAPSRDKARPISRLHLWQIQPVRDIALVLLVLWIIQLGYAMSVVTVPLLLGLLLAYLLEPPISWLAKRTSRAIAAGTAIAIMAVIVLVPVSAATYVAVNQGFQFAESLDDDLVKFFEKAENFLTYLERDSVKVVIEDDGVKVEPGDDESATEDPEGEQSDNGAPPPPALGDDDENGTEDSESDSSQQDKTESEAKAESKEPEQAAAEPEQEKTVLQRWATVIRQQIQEYFGSMRQPAMQAGIRGGINVIPIGWGLLLGGGAFAFKYFFLTPFFFFFWSISLGSVKQFGAQLIPKKHRAHTLEVIGKMDRAIAAFIRGRLTIALILAVLYTIAYSLIGVPAPLIFGPVIGLASAVPYLPLLGWPATMLAMAVDQAGAQDPYAWWWIILGPTIVYFAFQTLDDYVLTPAIQGKNVGLSTPVILFAVLGAGALAGVYGVLIAIPIAACIKILITDVVFPRYKEWVEGKADDPLPISGRDDEDDNEDSEPRTSGA